MIGRVDYAQGVEWKAYGNKYPNNRNQRWSSTRFRAEGIFDYDTKKDRLAEVELELADPHGQMNLSGHKNWVRAISLETVVKAVERLEIGFANSKKSLPLRLMSKTTNYWMSYD